MNKTFIGITVAPDLTRRHFFFLYQNTLIIGILLVMPAILQPAFLKDVLNVSPEYFGYINGFLQSMSQLATLFFVGLIGVISDKVGRKILAVSGFVVLAVFYYLMGQSAGIAAFLQIPVGFSSKVCAALSFTPSAADAFAGFAPGLLVAYAMRVMLGIGIILAYPQFITMVADYTGAGDRGKGMALNGIMLGLASIIVFAAIVPIGNSRGVEGLFVVASLLAVVGGLGTMIFLKDRRPRTIQCEAVSLRKACRVVMGSSALKTSYLCALIGRADMPIMATFIIAWAVRAGEQAGLPSEAATQKGALPMIILSTVSFISFPVVGRMLDRWGRVATLLVSLVCSGVGILVIALGSSPFAAGTLLAVVLVGFGAAGILAGTNTLATDAAPHDIRGTIMGGLNTMYPLGMLFYLQVGGLLFDRLGPGWTFGLKGASNLALALWLCVAGKKIAAEQKRSGSGAVTYAAIDN